MIHIYINKNIIYKQFLYFKSKLLHNKGPGKRQGRAGNTWTMWRYR